jgi:hypothetical protein
MNTHTHTHTPGQWNDTGNDGKDNLIVESEYGSICAVWRVNGYACQAADARLISAAPDMLAACKGALRAIREHNSLQSSMGNCIIEEAYALITAIARAEGGGA